MCCPWIPRLDSCAWGLFPRGVIKKFQWNLFLEGIDSSQGRPSLACGIVASKVSCAHRLQKKVGILGSNSTLCFT